MKINKFKFENFKSIKEAELNFLDNNHFVIIGENGCGKTHSLEALDWFFNIFDVRDNNSIANCVDRGKELIITVNAKISKTNAKCLRESYSFGFFKFSENNELKIKCSAEKNNQKYSVKLVLNGKNIKKDKKDVDKFIIDIFRDGYKIVYIPILMHNSSDFYGVLERLILKVPIDNIDTCQIDHLLKDHAGDKYNVNHKMRHIFNITAQKGGKIIPIEKLNSGAKKELFESLIIDFKSKNNDKIILLYDEFELHYHPNKIVESYEKIKKSTDFSVITTHSREFVDNCKNTRYDVMKDGVLRSVVFNDKRKLFGSTRITGIILFSKKIIFCEGYSDAVFLEGLVRKFVKDYYEICVVALEGCGNHKNVKKFLKDNDIRNYIFVLDRDAFNNFQKQEKVIVNANLLREVLSELDHSVHNQIKDIFNGHSFKKENIIYGSDGYPKFVTEKKFNIGSGNSKKYLIFNHDLEIDIFFTKKGKKSVKKVISSVKSVKDVVPNERNFESYKKKNIEILDDYLNRVEKIEDLAPKLQELINTITQK